MIIGAGFGGLAAAVALRRKGIDDLLIIERADGVGGTWRQNVYPGAACDIQSHLYSFSFAPNRTVESHVRLSAGDPRLPREGRRRLRPSPPPDARHIRAQAACGTRKRGTGRSSSADGATVVADVVVSAVGLFGAARYPDIDGLADFSGDLMHTARWDATVDLTGKRVAVIGTGASGVQVVPELADTAAQLTVFQRTPPWMVPKEDRALQRRGACRDSVGIRGRRGASGGGCGNCNTTTPR